MYIALTSGQRQQFTTGSSRKNEDECYSQHGRRLSNQPRLHWRDFSASTGCDMTALPNCAYASVTWRKGIKVRKMKHIRREWLGNFSCNIPKAYTVLFHGCISEVFNILTLSFGDAFYLFAYVVMSVRVCFRCNVLSSVVDAVIPHHYFNGLDMSGRQKTCLKLPGKLNPS